MSNKYSGHIIVAACFMIQAVGIGTYVSYGVFFNSLAREFEWSRAAVSGASSLAFILSGVFAILIGRLNDVYGPRNLMRVAAVFLGAGVMLLSQITAIWQLYLFYGLVFGIGLGAIDVLPLTTTARWFSHSRGFMTGLVKVGTGAGQFLVPLLASFLIVAWGWRQAYLILGAAVVAILVTVAQVLRRDPLSGNRQHPVVAPLATRPAHPQPIGLGVHDAFHTLQLWIICGVNVLIVFCLLIILVHIVPHASDLDLSPPQAAGVLSTIGAVSMFGRFCVGIAIDRVGSKPIMVVCFCILIAGLLWLQVADSLWMLYLFASVYGLAHGGFFTAISPMIAEIFGIDSHGAIFGIVVFFGTAGGALGPIVAGLLFDMTGSYEITFQMITLVSLAGLGLILLLKPLEVVRLEKEEMTYQQNT